VHKLAKLAVQHISSCLMMLEERRHKRSNSDVPALRPIPPDQPGARHSIHDRLLQRYRHG
jgi:hypothetical protein